MTRQTSQSVTPRLEMLEERRMLSASLSSRGVLDVEGTRRADVVTISKTSTGRIDVSVNGVHQTFRGRLVHSIVVNAGRGDDSVAVSNNNRGVGVRRSIDGGAGDGGGGGGPDEVLTGHKSANGIFA